LIVIVKISKDGNKITLAEFEPDVVSTAEELQGVFDSIMMKPVLMLRERVFK